MYHYNDVFISKRAQGRKLDRLYLLTGAAVSSKNILGGHNDPA